MDVLTATRIVGIGASAGGLESLEQLFGALPATTGAGFVVVQHLSPDFKSLMDELIARHSAMPVLVAQSGMPVEPNHIYVMPPKKEMIIRDRHLILADKEPQVFTLPIDIFMRSLAQDCGRDAVAVILSGSGSDGSRGIIDVDRAGGLVLAETARSAKFDGMPLAALETGVVDHCYPPTDLARIIAGLQPALEDPADDILSDDPLMDSILRLLRDSCAIDFSLYKTTTVGRRIQRRIHILDVRDLRAYHELLQTDPEEINALYRDLLIGVTQFFRDIDAFAALEREVATIVENAPENTEVRVWSAACATGEEAYSIAILFHEAIGLSKKNLGLKVLATDVHQASIDHAGIGIYGEERLVNMSPDRLRRYFVRRAGGYQVIPELRQLLVFARHNVTKDPPFTKMALVSCRNLLIYLQPNVQHTVVSLFHFGLATNGVLFLGSSESPGALSEEFITIDEHSKLYRKRRDVHLLSHVRLSLPSATQPLQRTNAPHAILLATYDQLLDRFMPPGFLVDENRQLIDSFGGAEKLLESRGRRPSQSILELVKSDLRPILGSAIQRALVDGGPVQYGGVRVPLGDDELTSTTIEAVRLDHPRAGARHVVVTFRAENVAMPEPAPRAISMPQLEIERMGTLESELAQTRETLQTTIEELETSNEEMQATNEELVAANEELQSTNEELHSVNEELHTVNAEYQHKIAELKELNADMQHLLEGTDVGTVFLDRELKIRRFTAKIANVFRFQRHDVGRELADFSHNIERPKLNDEIAEVRRTGTIIEDEVRERNGTPYLLRILPYRVAGTDEPMGVVLTVTDISTLERTRSKLAQLSAIVESSDDAIVGKGLDGKITAWNHGAEVLYGYSAEEALGSNVSVLMADGSEDELHGFVMRLKRGERIEHVRSLRRHKDGHPIEVSVTISPINDANGRLCGISGIARDITQLVAATRELADGARNREQFLAMLSHELRNPLAAVINAAALLSEDHQLVSKCQPVIARQARHMKRLLDDLLDVSRITRGKFALQLEDIDLRDAIDAAIETTAPIVREREIDLAVDVPSVPIPVRGDLGRLVQVFGNLVTNACNYSPARSHVRLVVVPADGFVTLAIRDHGFGIARDMLPRIFELFVQSEQRLDRSRGGLGVGLSLAKNIVELHDGTISAESDGPNLGSQFIVTMPLRASVKEQPHRPKLSIPNRRIVLVDDQDDAREMLRMLLESRSHTVHDAGDGHAAVELINREKPDIAFIDIGMPVMNGLEVARKIRENAALDSVRLIALTGYGASSDLAAAKSAGFDDHVIKPADLNRIEQILATLGN